MASKGFDAAAYIHEHLAELPELHVGSVSHEVKLLRRALGQKGYGPAEWWTDPEVSPRFDQELEVHVWGLQQQQGITRDGIVGRETWQRLASGDVSLVTMALKVAGAQPAEVRPRTIAIADAIVALSIREKNNRGPQVEEIVRFAGGSVPNNPRATGMPYCIAFTDFCMTNAYHSLNLAPPFRPGLSSSMLYQKAKGMGRIKDDPQQVKPGDIGLLRGGSSGWRHGFLIKAVDGHKLYTLEGNTNMGGSAEGDGIYAYQRIWAPGKIVFVDIQ